MFHYSYIISIVKCNFLSFLKKSRFCVSTIIGFMPLHIHFVFNIVCFCVAVYIPYVSFKIIA